MPLCFWKKACLSRLYLVNDLFTVICIPIYPASNQPTLFWHVSCNVVAIFVVKDLVVYSGLQGDLGFRK